MKALGVSSELLRRLGAVCGEVAIRMAEGALVRSPATLAVSITGVAGPEPDEDNNPVGWVCNAVACEGQAKVAHPDAGGSHEAMMALTMARDEALAAVDRR
jgi:PncC family amidohydrolase